MTASTTSLQEASTKPVMWDCECEGCDQCEDTGGQLGDQNCERAAIVHVTDTVTEYRACGHCADDALASGEGWKVRITAGVRSQ